MRNFVLLFALFAFACSGTQYFVSYTDIKELTGFSQDLAAVKVGEEWGYINPKGEFVIEPVYSFAGAFRNSIAPVRLQNKFGFIDIKGKMIIPAKFEDAKNFSQDMAPVMMNGKWGYINTGGELKIDFQYLEAKPFSEGYAAVLTSEGWGYIKQNGKTEIEPEYLDAGGFVNGKAPVKTKENNHWGFINKSGKYKIEPIYDYAEDFVSIKHKQFGDLFLALVQNDGKYGYIDEDGKYTINPEYDEAHSFEGNYATAKAYGKWGMIDYKNNVIIDFNFDEAGFFISDLLLVVKNGNKYYTDISGKDAGVMKIKATDPEPLINESSKPENCLSCLWGTDDHCYHDCIAMNVSFLNMTNEDVILTTDNTSAKNIKFYNNVRIKPGQYFIPEDTEPKGTINVSVVIPGTKWISTGLDENIFTKVVKYGKSLYAGGSDTKNNKGLLFKSDDEGFTWKGVTIPEDITMISGITVQNNSLFLAARELQVFRTDDNCKTWKQLKINLDKPEAKDISSADGVLYAKYEYYADNERYESILTSSDNGESWNWKMAESKNRSIKMLTSSEKAVFAIFSYTQNKNSNGVYRTTNKGNSWEPVLLKKDIRYINSDGKGLICNDSNTIYFSSDEGITWKNVTNPKPMWAIQSTFIKEFDIYYTEIVEEGVLYSLCTLYKSTNYGQNWASITGNTFKYEIEPVTFYEEKLFALSKGKLYACVEDTTIAQTIKYASLNLNRVILHRTGMHAKWWTNTIQITGSDIIYYEKYSGVNSIGTVNVNAYASRSRDYTVWVQNVSFYEPRYDCENFPFHQILNPVTVTIDYTLNPRLRQYP